MMDKEKFFFLIGPGLFVDMGAEVVVPSFPALLACSLMHSQLLFQLKRYFCPIVDPIFLHQLYYRLIFLNHNTATLLLQDCLLIIY